MEKSVSFYFKVIATLISDLVSRLGIEFGAYHLYSLR